MNKILIGIITLAAILRIWGLSNNPPHLTSDEAALGYNAYSILKTARDEHGELLPVIFKSFGDWKPGLYIYLTVPFVALFGLSEFSVRLVGALSGIIAVYLIYKIVSIFVNKLGKENYHLLPVFSAFFLSISPWHIHFTRGAWEISLNLTLLLAGLFFFLKGLYTHQRYLYLSAFIFSLTLWAYQGAKLSTAILLILLLILFYKDLLKLSKKIFIKAIFIGILISIPVLLSLFQGKAGRLEVFSVFSYPRSQEYIQNILDEHESTKSTLEYKLYHSEALSLGRGVLGRLMNHYSGRFLFIEGDWSNPRHSIPNTGMMLLVDSILLLAGITHLIRVGFNRISLLILGWLILSPLPAALSRDSIHAVRSFNMVIPLTIVLAFGLHFLTKEVLLSKKKLLRNISIIVLLAVYIGNYFYYLDQYWIHQPSKNSKHWQYGYKQIFENLALLNKSDEIIVKQDYSQPYIYYLFYNKYSPAKYQEISKEAYVDNKFGDVGLVSKIENVSFRNINWSSDSQMVGKVFVVSSIEVLDNSHADPKKYNVIKKINYLDNQPAFKIIEIL